MNPYYADDAVTIYHGDCREIAPGLDPSTLLLTDPPYNAGLSYDGYSDDLAPDDYARFTAEWFAACRRVTTSAIVFPGHGNLPMWLAMDRPSAIGCWYKPGNPASSQLGWCEWEPWLYWGTRLGGSDTIRSPVSDQEQVGDHPCPKPLDLFRKLVAKTKAPTVLDPFCGSGTTLRAAKDHGVRAIGIEQSERYCETAAKRMGQEVLAFG